MKNGGQRKMSSTLTAYAFDFSVRQCGGVSFSRDCFSIGADWGFSPGGRQQTLTLTILLMVLTWVSSHLCSEDDSVVAKLTEIWLNATWTRDPAIKHLPVSLCPELPFLQQLWVPAPRRSVQWLRATEITGVWLTCKRPVRFHWLSFKVNQEVDADICENGHDIKLARCEGGWSTWWAQTPVDWVAHGQVELTKPKRSYPILYSIRDHKYLLSIYIK